jgi:hypothetical protein
MLAKELKTLAHEMSHKTGTRFHFHKEYFWTLTERRATLDTCSHLNLISTALGTGKEDRKKEKFCTDARQTKLTSSW